MVFQCSKDKNSHLLCGLQIPQAGALASVTLHHISDHMAPCSYSWATPAFSLHLALAQHLSLLVCGREVPSAQHALLSSLGLVNTFSSFSSGL